MIVYASNNANSCRIKVNHSCHIRSTKAPPMSQVMPEGFCAFLAGLNDALRPAFSLALCATVVRQRAIELRAAVK